MPDDQRSVATRETGLPATALPIRQARGLLLGSLVLEVLVALYIASDGMSVFLTVLLAGSGVVLVVASLGQGENLTTRQLNRALMAVLAIHLVLHLFLPYRPEASGLAGPIVAIALVGLTCLGLAIARPRLLVPVLSLACSLAMLVRIWLVASQPQPTYDVYWLISAATGSLGRGLDPYGAVVLGRHFPYWPGTLLTCLPGWWLGDIRWSLVSADALVALVLIKLARKTGLGVSTGLQLASLYLWSSAGFFIVWQGFPEPLVVALVGISLLALTSIGTGAVIAPMALGLALATKQQALALVPMGLLAMPLLFRRLILPACAVAALLLTFFAYASPGTFIGATITAHAMEPPRAYSLDLTAVLQSGGEAVKIPVIPLLMLGALVGTIISLRWHGGIAGWLVATAIFMFVVFAGSGIAFVNYYQLVVGILLLALTQTRIDRCGLATNADPTA